MADHEYINGAPELMRSYSAQGPDPAAVAPGGALVFIADTEGEGFVNADLGYVGSLLAFVAAANAGIEHLREVARVSGDAYLEADTAGRFALVDLTEPAPPSPKPI
jgi:hypothetical protein